MKTWLGSRRGGRGTVKPGGAYHGRQDNIQGRPDWAKQGGKLFARKRAVPERNERGRSQRTQEAVCGHSWADREARHSSARRSLCVGSTYIEYPDNDAWYFWFFFNTCPKRHHGIRLYILFSATMPGYFVDCNITICSFFWLIKPDFSPFKEKLVRLIKKKLVKKEFIKNELNIDYQR